MRTILIAASCLVFACQSEPESRAYSSGVTLFAEKPSPASVALPVAGRTPPPGMVLVPGGQTQIGDEAGMEWEKPLFWVQIRPFFMDEHPVTVADFRKFVETTHYRTQAETFGDGGTLNEETGQWALKAGASWHHPQGPGEPAAPDNHPVTQVSWNDAVAYARWAGKRLPSEFEWEHAARNGVNSRTKYPFGNDLQDASGNFLANTWNGRFPQHDAVADGFHHTSPVGQFGKTPLGLTDMSGNVWEWCDDWKQNYADLVAGTPPQNPTEKVQRGGSFLCEPGWCHGYRVSGRSFTSPETSLMHVGFRCVKDL
ncbi:formylglycine-generating enzyme family protein [Tellurirhabdus rosea]|uniref:formylglycine-generating enzyme family protein n=1 Tax=Tellurirhabdus rosea TaxID=2674997 RepID=UPI00225105B0|nr:formylglycine-generating enzyme family protein [Tellurirhabdus rosea]